MANRAQVLSPDMHHRIAPTALLEDRLRRWLARQTEDVRRGYWLGVLMADGQVTATQLPDPGEPVVEPPARGVICEECGEPIEDAAPGSSRRFHDHCRRARAQRREQERKVERARGVVGLVH